MLTIHLLFECQVLLFEFQANLFVQIVSQQHFLLVECILVIVLLHDCTIHWGDLVEGLVEALIDLDVGVKLCKV